MVAVFPILCFAQSNTGQANSSIQNATSTNSLLRELKAMDSKLFDAIFKDCDLATLQNLLTDDFEFYHDKNGLMATNGAQFVEIIRKTCEGQKTGKEVRSRRELVSMEVYPLSHYGAIQTGVHRFFIIRNGQPDQAGDVAKFTHVWRKIGNDWRIARVLSYDHKLAQ